MAHATYEDLGDLEPVLEVVRGWERLKERKPGIFYMGGKGFLHFHIKGERRWADVRCGADWGPQLDVPAPSTQASRKRFLRELKRCHRETLAAR